MVILFDISQCTERSPSYDMLILLNLYKNDVPPMVARHAGWNGS